ncbi:MAG TPA: hypothetical protein VGD62_04615 [Acidobacteriaceae bacterium]
MARRLLLAYGVALLLAAGTTARGQSAAGAPPISKATPTAETGEVKARKLLDQMVAALGGPRWLALKSTYLEGRTSGFYQGKPTGSVTDFFSLRTPPGPQGPGEERTEYTKKHDVVSIFTSAEAWEITYRGKTPIPAEQASDYFRRRDHSVEQAVLVWLRDPATILLSEGQTEAERHLSDQVTLISSANESITLQLDTESHLPLRRLFRWRDPLYKDLNEEAESYDDYHLIDGVQTPFSLTRFHNGDMVSQRFLYRASYNVPAPAAAFDPDATAARLKH